LSVAFIGLGAMGGPMAARLVAAGIEVFVHDADLNAVTALGKQGAKALSGKSHDTVEMVITMLPDGRIVRDVLLGDDGLVQRLRPGTRVVDMSSAHPADTQATGLELASMGFVMLDAPVSGGVPRAAAGTLAIMAGGDDADVTAASSILTHLGVISHVGPLGSGHAIKALNNLLSATGLAAATEVLLIAKRFGIEPERALAVINASTGRNNATETKLAQFVLSRSFASGFALDLQAKDLAIAMDLAERTATSISVTAAAAKLVDAAKDALGPRRDHTEVARHIESIVNDTLG
jgi:3-hydroxyisobutyrate dehydrogenase